MKGGDFILDESLIGSEPFGKHKYIEALWTYVFTYENYLKLKASLDTLNLQKGVCGKSFTKKDVAWRCEECKIDKGSIICQDCFESSNHTDHRVWLDREVRGICDCGDPESWNPNGFCPKHEGFVEELKASMQLLPQDLKDIIEKVINLLCLRLYSVLHELKEYDLEDMENELKEIMDEAQMIMMILRQMCNVSSIILYAISREIMKVYEYYYTEDEEGNIIKVNDVEDSCSLIEIMVQVHYVFPIDIRINIKKFIYLLFQNLSFKKYFAEIYIKNYREIYKHAGNNDSFINSIGIQLFFMEDTFVKLLKSQRNIDIIVSTIKDFINTHLENCNEENRGDKFTKLINEISILKGKSIIALIQSNFLDQYLDILKNITAARTILMVHDNLESKLEYITDLYDIEYGLAKIFNVIAEGIDYEDNTYCKYLASVFKRHLIEVCKQLEKVTESYFTIPLHRAFGYFLMTYVQIRLFYMKSEEDLGLVTRNLLKDLFDIKSDGEYDSFIKKVLRSVLKVIGFMHEIEAKKWIYYHETLEEVCKHYGDNGIFFDASLCALLLSSLSNPRDLALYLFDSLSQNDNWLFTYVSELSNENNKTVDELTINLTLKDIELEKVKRILENALYFLCGLCTNDTLVLSLLWKAIKIKRCNLKYKEKLKGMLKGYKKYDLAMKIIHYFFRKKKLAIVSAKIKTIVSSHITDAELNDCLKEIAIKTKDKAKKIDIYTLKTEALKYYNPFYYMTNGKNPKSYEKAEELFKKTGDSKIFNPVFGSHQTNPLMKPIDFSKAMRKTLSQCNLIPYFIMILNGYKETISDFQIICVLKLIQQLKVESEELKKAVNNGLNHLKQCMKQYEIIFNEYQTEEHKSKSSSKSDSAAKQIQNRIIEEFKKRGKMFAAKNVTELEDIKIKQSNKETLICSICKEELKENNFENNPFGFLLFSKTSNSYYHYMKQAYTFNKKELGYTHGLSAITCEHSLHYKCAESLLSADSGERSCPLCKAAFIGILPNLKSLKKIKGKTNKKLWRHISDLFRELREEQNKIEGGDSDEDSEEETMEDYFDVLRTIIPYNAFMIDCTSFNSFIQKQQIFLSIFYSAKFLMKESVKNNWNEFSYSIIDIELNDVFYQYGYNLLVTCMLPVWSNIMLFIKLQEDTINDLKNTLDECCTVFAFVHLIQATIRELFVANGRGLDRMQLEEMVSQKYLAEFIPLFEENIKRTAVSFLLKAAAIRFVLFNEKCFDDLESLFNPQENKIEAFDKVMNMLGCCEILTWIKDPYYTFKKFKHPLFGKIFKPEQLLPVIKESLAQANDFVYIPQELEAINPTHTFTFLGLKPTFSQLEQIHYKRKCKDCNSQRRKNALCLLCGDILCVSNKCCVSDERALTRHTRSCGIGKGIYFYFPENRVLLLFNSLAVDFHPIYINQYGDWVFSQSSEMYEEYKLNLETVKELINVYCNNKIPQMVMYEISVNEANVDLNV